MNQSQPEPRLPFRVLSAVRTAQSVAQFTRDVEHLMTMALIGGYTNVVWATMPDSRTFFAILSDPHPLRPQTVNNEKEDNATAGVSTEPEDVPGVDPAASVSTEA